MALFRSAAGGTGTVEVLGTLALVAPKLDDFQFVRCRVWRSGAAYARSSRPQPAERADACELAGGINTLGEQREIKLIVLDSAGKTFCGGIELGEYTQRRVFQLLDAFHARSRRCSIRRSRCWWWSTGRPRRRRGAGGAGRPGDRDSQGAIRAAGNQARSFSAAGRGDPPYILGPKQALELVLTGEAMTAERARELGLVNWLVPEDELQKKVNDVIAKVTAQSGPVLTMAKKAIIGSLGLPLRDGVRNSMKVFLNELAELEDSQEGLRALVEKRAPKWKNR